MGDRRPNQRDRDAYPPPGEQRVPPWRQHHQHQHVNVAPTYDPRTNTTSYPDSYGNSYGSHDRYDRPPSPRRYGSNYRQTRAHDSYQFRGQANYQASHNTSAQRRPEDQFTFRAPRPRFPYEEPPPPPPPPPNHDIPPPPPPVSRLTRSYGTIPTLPRRGRDERHAESTRGDRFRSGRYNAGRGGRAGYSSAAHQRDILYRTQREATPEQLAGMNKSGESRFKEINSIGKNDAEDEDDPETDDAPRKRVKVAADEQTQASKWSNPEFYTSLPAMESTGPKKDIVKDIRKAKAKIVPNDDVSRAFKDNEDFIAFDDDNDDQDDQDMADDGSKDMEIKDNSSPARDSKDQSGEAKAFGHGPPINTTNQLGNSANSSTVSRTLATNAAFSLPPKPPQTLVMPTDHGLAGDCGKNAGKKRKRQDQATKPGEVSIEWKAHPLGEDASPWHRVGYFLATSNGIERLSEEIDEFYEFVRPQDYERMVRENLVKRIQAAVDRSNKPNVRAGQLTCFGSFAAGLYLPTADMDLVALSRDFMNSGEKIVGKGTKGVRDFGNHLIHSGITSFDRTTFLTRVRVPIVKLVDRVTDLKVDISFENDSGIHANATFQQWKIRYPAMPKLVVIIKQLLAMRNLNEVHNGGLGGFSIICLVVHLLSQEPEAETKDIDQRKSYGRLLDSFLDLYGNRLNITTTGLNMNPPSYFDKTQFPGPFSGNNQRLTIMDPNRPDNDISGGSHNIRAVIECFRSTHAALQRRLAQVDAGQDADQSILECVLGGNYSSFTAQRNHLHALHTKGTIYDMEGPRKDLRSGPPGTYGGRVSHKQTNAETSTNGTIKRAKDHPGIASAAKKSREVAARENIAAHTGGRKNNSKKKKKKNKTG